MTTAAPPLTIFAIPRAFKRNIGIAQNNAIRSWHALRPRPRILLLGDDEGTAEIARETGAEHIPQVQRNEFGPPLLSSAFALAHAAVNEGLMMFINSDIIMTSDLARALESMASPEGKSLGDTLLVGRRTCMYVRHSIDFSQPHWESTLRLQAAAMGTLWGPTAFDYFVFPHHMFSKVPPFAVGRGWWDHWLVAEGRRRGAKLVDCSPSILAIHQNHDFLATEESIRNTALFGLPGNSISIELADHVLRNGRFQTRSFFEWATLARLFRSVSRRALRVQKRLEAR